MRGRTGPDDRGTTDTNVRWADKRNAYVRDHPLLLSVATGAAGGGMLFMAMPHIVSASALGVLPGNTERWWAVVFAVSGLLVIEGMRRLEAGLEVAGLMLMAGCYASWGYTIFAARGTAAGISGAFAFWSLAFGLATRAYVLRFEPEFRPWKRRRV